MQPVWRMCVLLLLIMTASGCSDRPVSFYAFGPAKSCFPISDRFKCDKLKVYDKVELRVSGDTQEVVFVQRAIGLDDSNTVFKKLSGCKVVSRDTFSCEGLVQADGRFTETKVFPGLTISRSFWPGLTSQYLGLTIRQRTVQFFHKHHDWLDPILSVIAFLMVLGVLTSIGSRAV
jgi:hypothetical protein